MVFPSPERPAYRSKGARRMNSITNEYLATARMNDRIREATGRTDPVRRTGGVAILSRLVALVRRPFSGGRSRWAFTILRSENTAER